MIGLVAVLAVIDALRADYTVDLLPIGIFLGSALVLLGVEAGRRLLGPGGE